MTQLSTRFLYAVSLVVTDRRWAATLSATALGFGLFIGVAIGPGAAGTLATSPTQIIEIPAPDAEESISTESGDGARLTGPTGGGGGAEASSSEAPLPLPAPFVPEAVQQLPAGEPAPSPPLPAPKEAEAPEPETETLKGTVVHANPAAGSYSLAIAGGELVAVHAPELPAPGARLSVPLRRLANGTFAEAGAHERLGRVARATFRGTVSFVDASPEAPAYTVSGRGASILVRVQPDLTGIAPQLPSLGSYATVGVDIERPPVIVAEPESETAVDPEPPTCALDLTQPAPPKIEPAATLWQQRLEVEGEPSTYTDLAGIVIAVCPESGQLLLSADDIREDNEDIVLAVPPSIDSAKLAIGDSFLATATIEAGGSLTLAGIANDERTKGADDPMGAQGDLKRQAGEG